MVVGVGKYYFNLSKRKVYYSRFGYIAFLESFTTLLYNARFVECLPAMLRNSAYFMLRGIMTANGIERFERLRDVSCKKVN